MSDLTNKREPHSLSQHNDDVCTHGGERARSSVPRDAHFQPAACAILTFDDGAVETTRVVRVDVRVGGAANFSEVSGAQSRIKRDGYESSVYAKLRMFSDVRG